MDRHSLGFVRSGLDRHRRIWTGTCPSFPSLFPGLDRHRRDQRLKVGQARHTKAAARRGPRVWTGTDEARRLEFGQARFGPSPRVWTGTDEARGLEFGQARFGASGLDRHWPGFGQAPSGLDRHLSGFGQARHTKPRRGQRPESGQARLARMSTGTVREGGRRLEMGQAWHTKAAARRGKLGIGGASGRGNPPPDGVGPGRCRVGFRAGPSQSQPGASRTAASRSEVRRPERTA